MDKSRAFGICTACHTGNDGDDAGADVGTHGKENTLVDVDKSCDYHGQSDGGHHRGTLDDGG